MRKMARPTKFDDMAPSDAVWWCPQCGRISADRHGKLAMLGWNEHCSLVAVLVSESSMVLDPKGRVIQADLIADQPAPLPGSHLAGETHF
jgi:hypothetical protein